MMLPSVTVVIPTYNKSRYIASAVRSVLQQDYPNLTILVSNNHSTDSTSSVLSTFSDPRLSVISPPQHLSMQAHYEWCLSFVNTTWVTILGDDDGLMTHFSQLLMHILHHQSYRDADTLSFRRSYFFWPDSLSRNESSLNFSFSSNHTKLSYLNLLISSLTGYSYHYDYPQCYTNNLIKTSLISRIKSSYGGQYIHELNPDVSTGISNLYFSNCSYFFDFPLFWTGTSSSSIGLLHSKFQSQSTIDISSSPFLTESVSSGYTLLVNILLLNMFSSSPLLYTSLQVSFLLLLVLTILFLLDV